MVASQFGEMGVSQSMAIVVQAVGGVSIVNMTFDNIEVLYRCTLPIYLEVGTGATSNNVRVLAQGVNALIRLSGDVNTVISRFSNEECPTENTDHAT